MITINVVKNNEITNSASFNSEAKADIWLKQQLKDKSFGEVGTYQLKVVYKNEEK